jgi:hypothetical protein
MQKGTLEKFIQKFSLAGTVESVRWISDERGLHTHFTSDNKDVVGFLSTPEIKLDVGEYNIYEMRQLKTLLAVLGDEVEIRIERRPDGMPMKFNMGDGAVKVTFALSDSMAIPKVPSFKALPTPELVLNIDQKFREAFIRASTALADAETFAVMSDGTTVEVILGYNPDVNVHNVVITVEATVNQPFKPLFFTTKHLKEILAANKEMHSTTMSVSSKGLGNIKFKNDSFDADYYVMPPRKQL